jgi:hypothetical protein
MKILFSHSSGGWKYRIKVSAGHALVAHAYNPSYLGHRDQEDHGSKPALANSSGDPILKNLSQKMASGVAQGVGPEFKPHSAKGVSRFSLFKAFPLGFQMVAVLV